MAAYERELYPVIMTDPTLKQWISETLPVLRSNQKAREIADREVWCSKESAENLYPWISDRLTHL